MDGVEYPGNRGIEVLIGGNIKQDLQGCCRQDRPEQLPRRPARGGHCPRQRHPPLAAAQEGRPRVQAPWRQGPQGRREGVRVNVRNLTRTGGRRVDLIRRHEMAPDWIKCGVDVI